MRKPNTEVLKSLAWPTYLVALLLVVTPAMDFTANVWPVNPGSVQWRYGSVGLLAGFLLTPLMGIVLALFATAVLQHRSAMLVLSYFNVIAALFLLILIGFFSLDVLQVRATVPEEARGMFQTGAAKAALKHLSMAVALGWLGIAGIRITRGGKKEKAKPSSKSARLVRSAEAVQPRAKAADPSSEG